MLKRLFRNLWTSRSLTHQESIDRNYDIGIGLLNSGKIAEAVTYLECAHTADPTRPETLISLAKTYLHLSRFDDAYACYCDLEEFEESNYLALLGQAEVLRAAERYIEARAVLLRLVSIDPTNQMVLIALGDTYYRLADYTAAKEMYERCDKNAILANPAFCGGYGLVLRELGMLKRAHDLLAEANELNPGKPNVLTNLALIALDLSHYDEAIACCTRALEINPNHHLAKLCRGFAYIASGEFGFGWDDHEARRQEPTTKPRHFPFPFWGKLDVFPSTLFIYGEQGIGDEIMFASCIADARNYCKKTIVECADKLVPMFSRSFPWATVIGRSNIDSLKWNELATTIDCQIASGSLPMLFRRSRDAFPRLQRYLFADPERVAYWKRKFGQFSDRLTIGISWRGGSANTRKHLRTLNSQTLGDLLAIPNISFVNLQHDCTAEEIQLLPASVRERLFTDFSMLHDYAETAAAVSALDLVITVQTAIAHLAGALGAKTFVLVPVPAEWRYQGMTQNIPWYPCVTLFRQGRPGDWSDPIERIKAELLKYQASNMARTHNETVQ